MFPVKWPLKTFKSIILIFIIGAPGFLFQTFDHKLFCLLLFQLHLNVISLGVLCFLIFFFTPFFLFRITNGVSFLPMSQKWKHLSYFQFFMSCCFEKYWFQSFYSSCSVGLTYQERLGFHLYYSFFLRVNHVFSASYFFGAGMLLIFQGSVWEAFALI